MSSALPDGTTLLQRELQARQQGTGLQASDLVGCWRLHQTWGKGQRQSSAAASLLLRGLGARLELDLQDGALQIRNAVQLGVLELRFSGGAELSGHRPLLLFWFERLELGLGKHVLWARPIAKPERRRLPFFALIARDPQGWLAARGRGGGLALWTLHTSATARAAGSGAE
ncbi:MAG: hypothetical protein VKM98_09295 [Cyanobacteriota bacterium]|nr:hypothetical protein [Cyanobacteriota bacterium]